MRAGRGRRPAALVPALCGVQTGGCWGIRAAEGGARQPLDDACGAFGESLSGVASWGGAFRTPGGQRRSVATRATTCCHPVLCTRHAGACPQPRLGPSRECGPAVTGLLWPLPWWLWRRRRTGADGSATCWSWQWRPHGSGRRRPGLLHAAALTRTRLHPSPPPRPPRKQGVFLAGLLACPPARRCSAAVPCRPLGHAGPRWVRSRKRWKRRGEDTRQEVRMPCSTCRRSQLAGAVPCKAGGSCPRPEAQPSTRHPGRPGTAMRLPARPAACRLLSAAPVVHPWHCTLFRHV